MKLEYVGRPCASKCSDPSWHSPSFEIILLLPVPSPPLIPSLWSDRYELWCWHDMACCRNWAFYHHRSLATECENVDKHGFNWYLRTSVEAYLNSSIFAHVEMIYPSGLRAYLPPQVFSESINMLRVVQIEYQACEETVLGGEKSKWKEMRQKDTSAAGSVVFNTFICVVFIIDHNIPLCIPWRSQWATFWTFSRRPSSAARRTMKLCYYCRRAKTTVTG